MFGDEMIKSGKKELCECVATTGKMHTQAHKHTNKSELLKEYECK